MSDTNDAAVTSDDDAGETGRPIPAPSVTLPTGALVLEGAIVGSMDYADDGRPRINLNLGWLRLAGVSIRVAVDPDVDKQRSGFVLDR